MMGKTIGKSLGFGFAGNYSSNPDLIISAQIVKGTEPVYFGDPVALDADGFVRAVDATFTEATFVGVASAEIRSAVTVDNMDGIYRANNAASIMTRGAISVTCQKGAPKKGGAVFVRIAAPDPATEVKVGGFEAAADGADTVELSNCVWMTGADGNKISEIRLKNINLV